jgi:hypothetical protein
MSNDRIDLNKAFRNCPGQTLDPPWEPFWDCRNFATENCTGNCEDSCPSFEAYEHPVRW